MGTASKFIGLVFLTGEDRINVMGAYLIVGATAILGAIIQATMGFGTALLLLNVLPFFFPLNQAIALMQAAILVLNSTFTIRYWKKVRWEIIWPAIIPGVLLGIIFTLYSVQMAVSALTIAFGVMLIVLSIYELAFGDNFKVKPTKATGFLMGSLSGIGNAFFGVAGPPIAIYLIASVEDNLEYFATSQCFFFFSTAACVITRAACGAYEAGNIPFLIVVASCLLIGIVIGLKILKKIDGKLLRKLIYAFIGINGIYLIIKQIV